MTCYDCQHPDEAERRNVIYRVGRAIAEAYRRADFFHGARRAPAPRLPLVITALDPTGIMALASRLDVEAHAAGIEVAELVALDRRIILYAADPDLTAAMACALGLTKHTAWGPEDFFSGLRDGISIQTNGRRPDMYNKKDKT